ncbi:MAG: glutaminyl-peptide cyclotransferase [delta proteobacterium MLS_D]|jgi:glutaminyl-peptide cyclotransferase|nr:MAG: glutaminyl-peptide cyclotransferase [delta proteobacterium MLS_D]
MRRCLTLLLIVLVAACCREAAGRGMDKPLLPSIQVLAVYPHDSDAFTQGLVLHEGFLYESTGLYGASELRKVEKETGAVLQRRVLPAMYFGEGLAIAGNRLVQLTWREETAFIYDADSLEPLGCFTYEGEGWGLCFDGEFFYRSDGSDNLYIHDQHTFDVLNVLRVTCEGEPVDGLNELECVGASIYANIYTTNHIVRINKQNGRVTAIIDAGKLVPARERFPLPPDGVLNGIAHDPPEDAWYLTGKLWPRLFRVRFTDP